MPQSSSAANINVDINQIVTDLNLKADTDLINATPSSGTVKSLLTNAGVKYVVETFHNGTSWYRLYSDGWCEQGDSYCYIPAAGTTITLLKSYSSTDYSTIVCRATSNYTGAQSNPFCLRQNESTIFIPLGGGADDYAQWYACGWLAQ